MGKELMIIDTVVPRNPNSPRHRLVQLNDHVHMVTGLLVEEYGSDKGGWTVTFIPSSSNEQEDIRRFLESDYDKYSFNAFCNKLVQKAANLKPDAFKFVRS
jgi:hypothetical protein